MTKFASQLLPDRVAALLDAISGHPSVIRDLEHSFAVFADLEFDYGWEPYGDAFLYSYLLDGKSDLGERLRRTIKTGDLYPLVREAQLTSIRSLGARGARNGGGFFATLADHVSYFANQGKLAQIERLLAEHGTPTTTVAELAPLLMPLLSYTYEGHLDIIPQLPSFLRAESSAEKRIAAFVRRISPRNSAFELPGSYVLVVTDDGRRFRADLAQTMLHGRVSELNSGEFGLDGAVVSFPWMANGSRSIQGLLGEFEELINSQLARESDFQQFFEREPTFLYLLGNYDDVRSQVDIQVDFAVTPLSGSLGFRPDFFLHCAVTGLWDLLELKKAYYSTPLLLGKGAGAHHALGPSQVLSKALNQMRLYRNLLQQATVRDLMLKKYGMRVLAPRCVLLMGRESNFPSIGVFSTSEAIRESTQEEGVSLVTYDQLLRVARHQRL